MNNEITIEISNAAACEILTAIRDSGVGKENLVSYLGSLESGLDYMEEKYEPLKLSKQLCFPLYACSREIIKSYKPFLDEIDLTYTQYIAMMVLWEHKTMNVKAMGEILFLDSGTLTPVLKKLESSLVEDACAQVLSIMQASKEEKPM